MEKTEENQTLYVNYDNLSSSGETLINQSNSIISNIESIDTILNKNINENWIGSDKTAYVNSFNKELKSLVTYANEIHNIGDYLMSISGDYSDTKSNCLKGLTENE